MPHPQKRLYTAKDYWNLPEDKRAELINGQLLMMSPPNRIHQKLVHQFSRVIGNYINIKRRDCEIYPAPFAVNLTADDKTWVEPDISIICDKNKLTERGCEGAPDFIIEIVSTGSRKQDYLTKMVLYSESGVREYWIVDPEKERTTIYRFEEDAAPTIFPFHQAISVGIYDDLLITVSELLSE